MGYPGNDIDLGTILGRDEPLRLSRKDRARHTYVVGATRTGKTKLLEGMARQDLQRWPDHQCPLVVLDPHGTLYAGLMAYAAAEGLDHWPIVPLDLRRDDLVVSYDLLRKREGVDPAVVCRSFVDAILHAWGQSNSNETARLATWLWTLLMLAYERECSLAEALHLIREPDLRQRVAAEVRHLVARSNLQSVVRLREEQFQERVESTLYRVNRFLSSQLMRATLCARAGASLDLSAVLDEGKILLANLSVEGTKVAQEDAAALGSVLLTDLWTAARRRGKREEGALRPCYVYVDEFQNYVTPTVATGLSEASGYGLHLTLAHQYPSQLTDQHGEMGAMVLGAVLANAKNKLVFQLEHPQDLELLASILGRQVVDPDKVKQEIWSTKVLGHELTYLPTFGQSTGTGTTHTNQWSDTHTEGHTTGSNWGESEGVRYGLNLTEGGSETESTGRSDSEGTTEGRGDLATRSRQDGTSRSDSVSASEGEQWNAVRSTSSGTSAGQATGRTVSHSFGRPTKASQRDMKDYLDGEMDQEERDRYKRDRGKGVGLSESESQSHSDFHSVEFQGRKPVPVGLTRGRELGVRRRGHHAKHQRVPEPGRQPVASPSTDPKPAGRRVLRHQHVAERRRERGPQRADRPELRRVRRRVRVAHPERQLGPHARAHAGPGAVQPAVCDGRGAAVPPHPVPRRPAGPPLPGPAGIRPYPGPDVHGDRLGPADHPGVVRAVGRADARPAAVHPDHGRGPAADGRPGESVRGKPAVRRPCGGTHRDPPEGGVPAGRTRVPPAVGHVAARSTLGAATALAQFLIV